MRQLSGSQSLLLNIIKAGLWESFEERLTYTRQDLVEAHNVALEQSVLGLFAEGLNQYKNKVESANHEIPKDFVLTVISDALQLEQRNRAMNCFITKIIGRLKNEGIQALLVKGQGIAQCYEKPLWRACGDVDLLLDALNYEKAKRILSPLASSIEPEYLAVKHYGMIIDSFVVELHGTLNSHIFSRMDKVIEQVQKDVFENDKKRIWHNGDCEVPLPSIDNDIIFVFTHMLKHFYDGSGLGLRQICDWIRLLWVYRNEIDIQLLKTRLQRAGILNEWLAFSALAVGRLGMSSESMPLYSSAKNWNKKADKILLIILKTGSFGHGKDLSYKQKYPLVVTYAISVWRYTCECLEKFRIFPRHSVIAWWHLMRLGVSVALNEK